jgi:geranylgeranyl pyrophosphate synthase
MSCTRAVVAPGTAYTLLLAPQLFSSRARVEFAAAATTAGVIPCPPGCCCCSDINERHRRLAEIVEMLHTASLVHDDVLDECDLRRGVPQNF